MTTGPAMLGCALWVGAWLRGTAAPDDVLEVLGRLAPGSSPATLLAQARSGRPVGTWLLLPRPGRTVGWPRTVAGPPEPAVLLSDAAATGWLVRARHGRWSVQPAGPIPVASLWAESVSGRQARGTFEAIVGDAAARLERLGLDRPASVPTRGRWSGAAAVLPPGLDPDATAVLHRAVVLLDALHAALADDGAAVTSAESAARSGEVRQLVGGIEDVVSGVVGGLNPRPVA